MKNYVSYDLDSSPSYKSVSELDNGSHNDLAIMNLTINSLKFKNVF